MAFQHLSQLPMNRIHIPHKVCIPEGGCLLGALVNAAFIKLERGKITSEWANWLLYNPLGEQRIELLLSIMERRAVDFLKENNGQIDVPFAKKWFGRLRMPLQPVGIFLDFEGLEQYAQMQEPIILLYDKDRVSGRVSIDTERTRNFHATVLLALNSTQIFMCDSEDQLYYETPINLAVFREAWKQYHCRTIVLISKERRWSREKKERIEKKQKKLSSFFD